MGLPIALEEPLVEATRENIRIIAEASNGLSEPFTITADMIYDAIITTDRYDHHYKKSLIGHIDKAEEERDGHSRFHDGFFLLER